MGYRIGYQCLPSKEAATDFVMSSVSPVLTSDGRILIPQKIGSKWFFDGQEILLSFPECSLIEQMQSGALIGASFLTLFVIMSSFRLVYKFISGKGISDGG